MFDVIWTDPNVELVGQRMLRKEQEAKEKDKKKRESGHQSISTNSLSSSSERGFSLFPSKSKWKTPTPSKGKPSSSAPSYEDPERDDAKAHRASAHGVRAALAQQDNSDGFFVPTKHPEPKKARPPSPRDSVLSKWAQQAGMTTGDFDLTEMSNTVPGDSTESYLQTLGPSSFITQTIDTAFLPRTEGDIDQLKTETHVSSDGTKPQTPPLTETPVDASPKACEDLESFPIPHSRPKTPPPNGYQSYQISSSPKYQSYDHSANPEAWKPPHEWDCTPTKQVTAATIDERLQVSPGQVANNSMFPAFAALQRERRTMAAASTELMLTNLKSSMGEATDASVYKELEMTKKRWMFSALHQQGGYAQLIEQSSERPETPTQPKRNRILALYETHAPGGALHLTIIDPQPVSASMGPKLRQWLFTSLLINLEQAFRTTLPSETFPAWLAVGNLRGKGSTIAIITAPAIARISGKTDVKMELRCLVNRLLWQEVWGRFVTASRWWWEEEEIVQECIELGTHWQYSHIVAVKGDQY
ncbi:hypothetical protein O1611_g7133 [Lasiodiplodia mahajangana]|uniref:Uncharacterized protein n=1 Tax=Lasiodiplodia mahajangana TaxID=1108764 RepID=A0ACC2JGE3_9PEZI|nr:hypothetical protein O1611_g7133 [Lasiodiplodia mahajangana]